MLNLRKITFKKTYGTDYAVLGDGVENVKHETQGIDANVAFEYPAGSFRIPSDWQKQGQTVYVLVNPQTGKIAKGFEYPKQKHADSHLASKTSRWQSFNLDLLLSQASFSHKN